MRYANATKQAGPSAAQRQRSAKSESLIHKRNPQPPSHSRELRARMVRDKVSWDPPSGNESIRGSVCPRGNSAPAPPLPIIAPPRTPRDGARPMAQSRHILHTPLLPPPPPRSIGSPTAAAPRAGRRTPRTRLPRTAAAPKRLRAVMRRFLRCECASVALESAIALSVLVVAFSGLMHIVGDVYSQTTARGGAPGPSPAPLRSTPPPTRGRRSSARAA